MLEMHEEEQTCRIEAVVAKYKTAGEIVNRTLVKLIEKCVAGASVIDICEFGDKTLTDETSMIYKKDARKGIAFPTCICVNNCICHFSPLKSETAVILAKGDVVKIDLGAHIDGFIAVVAHTIVIGATKENKATGRKADVILAAHKSIEAALRLVRPGNQNAKVTEITQKVCESYKCLPIEGMLSHQLKQHEIDGEKSIIQNPSDAQRKEHKECKFEDYEVYALDVLVSTGEGRGKEKDSRCTVYKRTEHSYQLKRRTSRMFYSEIEKKAYSMPFTLRLFEDETRARLGVTECVQHALLDPFQVLYEKEGEFVAQFKTTVLLLPNGSAKITGIPFDPSLYQSQHKIEDKKVLDLLKQSYSSSNKNKNKKPAVPAAPTAPKDDAAGDKK
ncbi:proliferation-associated protein 2G4-like [Tropilaelaps mercedesae]|uniref:Proliferation-associated protein 2G4-like n=1 Tax=Tropilaelaps mercedesae TaxID=418985 RepID=A0A1V9X0B4_9ACAR|nr:proliferation-associated protein 2G4-like [Tropilaelaps mercedesae]